MCLDISRPICGACTAKFCHSCSIWSVLPPSSLPEAAVCARLSLHLSCYTENSARGVVAPVGGASLFLSCLAWDSYRAKNQVGTDSFGPSLHVHIEPHCEVLELRGAEGSYQLLLWRQRPLLQEGDFLKCKHCHSQAQSPVLKQSDVRRPLSTTSLPARNLTWHRKTPIPAKLCDLGSSHYLSDFPSSSVTGK